MRDGDKDAVAREEDARAFIRALSHSYRKVGPHRPGDGSRHRGVRVEQGLALIVKKGNDDDACQ